jgi:hypothetical protein
VDAQQGTIRQAADQRPPAAQLDGPDDLDRQRLIARPDRRRNANHRAGSRRKGRRDPAELTREDIPGPIFKLVDVLIQMERERVTEIRFLPDACEEGAS